MGQKAPESDAIALLGRVEASARTPCLG